MGRPTQGDVHVNQPLGNLSIAYMQSRTDFVATSVFATVPSDKQSNVYYKYNRDDYNRDEMRLRAPGTESAGSGYGLSTASYFCQEWALHKDISDADRANEDNPLNSDRDVMEFLVYKGLIRKEKIWVDTYFSNGVWGANQSTPGTLWSSSSSTPISDVKSKRRALKQATGFRPNIMVLGQKVVDDLEEHPEVIDRIKYGQTAGDPAIATPETLAKLFGISRVVVLEAIYNSAAQNATEDSQFIAGRHCLLAYSNPRPTILQPSAGYTFAYTGRFGANALGARMKSFYMEELESTRIEIQMAFDMKITGSDLAWLFYNTVAA
jgi:hypothetical protein